MGQIPYLIIPLTLEICLYVDPCQLPFPSRIKLISWGAACTFFDERQASGSFDERDVIERVRNREYDAGAVSRRTLEVMTEQGALPPDSVRVFWSSPGYSHCCFTAHSDLDPSLARKVTDVFLSVNDRDPVGKAVLEAEACSTFVSGTIEGYEVLEKVAEAEGLI